MSKKNGLFDNPMIEHAMKALTPEQRKEYENIGKYMFQTNFENIQGPDPENEMKEAIIYIKEGLKSGLHPEDLTNKELQIMYDIYGDNWYEDYGYFKEEVPPNPNLGVGLGTIANPTPSDNLSLKQIEKLNKKQKKLEKRANNKRTNKHKK